DAIVWQLRGYAAEESSAGANAGLIYRRAVADTLLGANVFLDYEQHGTYDEGFWRSSFGLELRSAHVNLYANRYWAITDPIADDGEYIYSKDGFDIEVAVKPLPELNVSGGVTYYKWDGEFGDADDKGLLYNLRVRPFSNVLKNIEIETQIDSPQEGDLDWGGKISYSHKLGAPLDSSISAKPLTFDPREHFFDPVRREYNQRIERSGGGDSRQNIIFVVPENSTGTVTLQALQANGNTLAHTLFYNSTLLANATADILAATITIDALGDGAALSLFSANGPWSATVSEKSHIVLENYGSTVRVITGTISVSRGEGSNIPDVIIIEADGVIGHTNVSIFLRGTDLEVGRVAHSADFDALVRLHSGTIRATINNTVHLRVSVHGGVAHITSPDRDPSVTALVSLQLGCQNSLQRDGSHYLHTNYDGCTGDMHLSGFSGNAVLHLGAQGEQLTINVNPAGTILTVVGDYKTEWASYPFAAISGEQRATLSVSGSGNIVYGSATVSISAGSELESAKIAANADNDIIHLLLRRGSITDIGASNASVDCSSSNLRTQTQTEGNLVILAACGDNITFADGDTRNISSRNGIANTAVITVRGGDGDYNFSLTPAGGIVTLENTSGSVATLVIFSAEEATNSFVLNASPADELIRQALGESTINISAEVVSVLSFASTLPKRRFRTELDSEIPLVTLDLSGGLGALTYNFVGTPAASYALYTLSNASEGVILSLASAIAAEETTAFTIRAIDSAGGALNATTTITITVESVHPEQETGELALQGVVVDNTLFINNSYTGILASVINIDNPGEFSGLDTGSSYAFTQPTLAFIDIVPVAVENRAIDINITATTVAGSYTISTELNDDHTGNGSLALNFTLQIVDKLAISSPGGAITDTNSDSSGAVATVLLESGTGLAPYTYSIAAVNSANNQLTNAFSAFSVDASGTVRFNSVSGLSDNAVVTVISRVTDTLGDPADFALTITIYTPLSVQAAAETVTVSRTYTAGDFYVPSNLINGGRAPYTSTITAVTSGNSALTTSSFNINSGTGALALNAAVAIPSIATVAISVTDASGGSAAYNVIVRLTDA
ncbi:MAG: inverse autotransporter beta domain-containing protein, partial [Proteobacteria bacterium]|nr:inverse autotransporter beta domain-containing protein [Pseudomonadota bacterium]